MQRNPIGVLDRTAYLQKFYFSLMEEMKHSKWVKGRLVLYNKRISEGERRVLKKV
jgi:hypothetical protein